MGKSHEDICNDLSVAAVSFALAERRYEEAKADIGRLIATPGTNDREISLARETAKIMRDRREKADADWKSIARAMVAELEARSDKRAEGMPR